VDCVKDEATLYVLRSAAGAAADGAKNLNLLVARSSPGDSLLTLKKPAAAPGLPEDLASWLAGLSLSAYAEPLGLVSMDDVSVMAEEDLKEAGLKPAERKRFLAAAKKLLPSTAG